MTASFPLGFLLAVILGISISRGNAQSWSLTSAPATNWTSITCSADGHQLVAVAGGVPYVPQPGQIYISTNIGTTWIPTTAPATGWAAIASSADGQRLFAAGSQGGPIYISTNGGTGWLADVQTPTPFGWWVGLNCSADGSLILAGSGGAGGEAYGGQVSISTNGGDSWVTSGSSGLLTCVSCSGDGRIMLQGLDAANGIPVMISTNWGGDWQNSPIGGIYSMGCSADGTKMIATGTRHNPAGQVFVSKDSGVSWNQVTNSGVAAYTVGISADGKTMLAAENATTVGGESPIFVSHDGGVNWSSNSFQNISWVSVASSADGSILMAAAGGGGIYTLERSPAPVLKTSVSSASLTLSWTVPSMNFVLQQAPDLASGKWTLVPVIPSLNYSNSQYQVTISDSQDRMFYRLASQ